MNWDRDGMMYWKFVRDLCQRKFRCSLIEAEDIASDTIAACIKSKAEPDNIYKFLYSVARRKMIDEQKRRVNSELTNSVSWIGDEVWRGDGGNHSMATMIHDALTYTPTYEVEDAPDERIPKIIGYIGSMKSDLRRKVLTMKMSGVPGPEGAKRLGVPYKAYRAAITGGLNTIRRNMGVRS